MAYIFQCDCCGQREPEVTESAVLVAELSYWKNTNPVGIKNRFQLCELCLPLVEKEFTLFLKKVTHGNT